MEGQKKDGWVGECIVTIWTMTSRDWRKKATSALDDHVKYGNMIDVTAMLTF